MTASLPQFISVQSLNQVWFFATPWTAACQASLSFTISQSLLKLMSIGSMRSKHLILCHPLLLLSSIIPSIRVFTNDLAHHIRWPKYWSFSINSSNEYSGLFPLGWIGWISLQSKGLSRVFSNTTVQKPQFFYPQPSLWSNSHIHTCLVETPQLWLYGLLSAKWCLLLFNTLSRFVIAFLPRSKRFLILRLQFVSVGA